MNLSGAYDLTLHEPPSLTWQPVDPPGWYVAEADHFTASIDTDRCKLFVFMDGHTAADLIALSDLFGSLGIAFPETGFELHYGVNVGHVYGWQVGLDDEGVWTLEGDF